VYRAELDPGVLVAALISREEEIPRLAPDPGDDYLAALSPRVFLDLSARPSP
jgi:hypothetical protein